MNNGSLIKTITNPHKSLESLDAAITEMENTIDELRKANDKLREEHYKDDTIAAWNRKAVYFQGLYEIEKIYDDIKYIHITFPLSLLKEEF